MSTAIRAGRANVAVTDAAESDLLSASASGLAILPLARWGLVVTFDDAITLRVYKRWNQSSGQSNCGLVPIAELEVELVAADSPHVIEFPDETADVIRVTAQCPAAGTAIVNCDFSGRSQS